MKGVNVDADYDSNGNNCCRDNGFHDVLHLQVVHWTEVNSRMVGRHTSHGNENKESAKAGIRSKSSRVPVNM